MYNVYAFCQVLLRNLRMTLNIASKGLIYPFAFSLVICCCTRKKGLYKKKNVSRLNLLLVVLSFCKHIYHAHLTLVANSTWLADVCAKTKSFFSCEYNDFLSSSYFSTQRGFFSTILILPHYHILHSLIFSPCCLCSINNALYYHKAVSSK